MSEEKKEEVLGQEQELDLDELDAVAGGGMCVCPFVGGGTADSPNEKPCACVMAGAAQSKVRDHGDPARCECVLAGYGI